MTTVLMVRDENKVYAAWDSKNTLRYSNSVEIYERANRFKVLRMGYGLVSFAGSKGTSDYMKRKMLLNKNSFIYSDYRNVSTSEELKEIILKEYQEYINAFLKDYNNVEDLNIYGTADKNYGSNLMYIDPFKFVNIEMNKDGDITYSHVSLAKNYAKSFTIGVGSGYEYAREYYNEYVAYPNKRLVLQAALMYAIRNDSESGFKVYQTSLDLTKPEIVRPFDWLYKNAQLGGFKNLWCLGHIFMSIKYQIINMTVLYKFKMFQKIEDYLNSIKSKYFKSQPKDSESLEVETETLVERLAKMKNILADTGILENLAKYIS